MSELKQTQRLCEEAHFVNIHKNELIHKVTSVLPILKDLLLDGILTEESYAQIRRAKTNQEQMRELYKALDAGGDEAKSSFYFTVRKREPRVLHHLGKDETSVRFVDIYRDVLIHEVTRVMPVVEDLLSQGILTEETCSQIMTEKTNQEQMRELYKALDAEGVKAKSAFYFTAMEHEPRVTHWQYLWPLWMNWYHFPESFTGAAGFSESLEALAASRSFAGAGDARFLRTLVTQYRTSVIDKFKFVTEVKPPSDERVLLADHFVNPDIIQWNKGYGENCSQTISIDQLFRPDSDGKRPKTVILSGDPGSGKSFMLQKIMLDWASGRLYSKDFDVVFLLKCEELKCVPEEMKLNELLSWSCGLTSSEISRLLQYSKERVVFIIDGYDLTLQTQFQSPDTSHGATCMNTLNSLLNGNTLPKSSLLVTTRSIAAEDVDMLKEPKCFIEMMGFSQKGVVEYFQKFFQDEQLFRKAYDCVKANETLQMACTVPLMCWIICFCLKYFPDVEDEMNKLKTTTSIYVHFVSNHCKSQSGVTLLKSLGQLAERGMQRQQILFEEKSLAEAGLVGASSLFLNQSSFKTEDQHDPMFKFIHLNFQEFFTALHYVLLDESCSDIVKQWFDSLESEAMYSRRSQNVRGWRSSRIPFVWFLCGLSNEKVSSAFFKKPKGSVSQTIREKLEVMISRPQNKDLHLALHCLFELHDDEFVRKVLNAYKTLDLSHISLKRTDCWVLLYCLQCCPHITELSLTHCDLTADKLKILQPALCMLESLRLMVDQLSEVEDLIRALGESKIFRELKVQEDEYSCEGWSLDLSVTQEDLLLCVCHSAFPSSSQLRISLACPKSEISSLNWTLILERFKKQGTFAKDSSEFDEQVSLLLSSFHPVSLKKLDLEVLSLTKSWASGIISIIQTCRNLQELSISVTGLLLEDELVLLQESLKDPHCTVAIKGWKCNKPTDQCAENWSLRCNEKVEVYFKPKVLEKLEELNISDPEPNLHPLPICQCCAHIVDSDEWIQVEPSVCRDEGESKFSISTQPGRYECIRTRMRWVCDCDVTLQYHAVDGRSLISDLERLQCERIGPVMDVTVISGKLMEAHLPHFACLAESDPTLKDAVKILNQKNEGVVLQSVELTRFHAKVIQPSFSLITLIINYFIQWVEHCNLLLYMRCKDPLILHVYFFPLNDTCSKEKVEQSEKASLQISHPRPDRPFRMKTPHLLKVHGASVHPIEGITFRRDIDPNFFKIKQDQDDDVQMTLIRGDDHTTVWEATVWKNELDQTNSRQNEPQRRCTIDNFVNKKNRSALIQRVTNVKSILDKMLEQEIIQGETYSEILNSHLTCQDRMRRICTIVDAGSLSVKAKFVLILEVDEPYLYRDLFQ